MHQAVQKGQEWLASLHGECIVFHRYVQPSVFVESLAHVLYIGTYMQDVYADNLRDKGHIRWQRQNNGYVGNWDTYNYRQ